MNKIYKVVWSKAKHTYVVASEIAKGHTKGETTGKGLKKLAAAMLVAAALLSPSFAWAADATTKFEPAADQKSTTAVAVYTKDEADNKFATIDNLSAVSTEVQTQAKQVNTNAEQINTNTTNINGLTTRVTALESSKTDKALHISDSGDLIVGTIEKQRVKDMEIRGELTSGSVSTGDITSSGDVTVAGKMAADGVTDETTKDGSYIKQNNTVGNNLVSLDKQVKANDERITNVKEYVLSETNKNYVSKTDAALQDDGAIVKKANTIGENVANLDAALAKETADRLGADAAQDKVIKQVNDNLVASVNTINKNVADGFTALNQAGANEAAAREAKDNELNERITNEANDIHETTNQLQSDLTTETTAREAADTALDTRITNVKEYLEKQTSDKYVSKDDAAVQDGAIVKAANTIGDNVTKLDAALAKETAARLGADAAQDKVIQQVNDNAAAGIAAVNNALATQVGILNQNDATERAERMAADAAETDGRVAADTELVKATNGGLALNDKNVLQKNETTIENGTVTTKTTAADTLIMNEGKKNQITLSESGIKVGTNSTVIASDGVFAGGDTADKAKVALNADGSIKGANGAFTVDENGNVTSKATITGETVTDGKGASMSNGQVTGKTLTDGIATITNGNINTSGTITGGTVTSTGNISALGDIHAGGAITGGSASIQGALTAGSATITGNLTAGGDIQGKSISDGTATMQNGNITGVKNLSAETITTSGNATIGGDLTVKGKLNVDEIDLTKNGIDGDYHVTSSTKVAAGEITSYKKATSTKDGSEKESAFDYDENGTSTWAQSTDADRNWNKSTLTVEGDKVTSKVVDSNKNTNEFKQTASASNSSITGTVEGKNYKSYITQNLKQILQKIEDGNGNPLTSVEQTEKDITNTAKNGTITNDADKVLNQGATSVTSQIGDGTAVKSELTAGGITNTAVGGTISNSAKDLVNTATGNMTNTVGGTLTNTVTGKVTEDYKSDLDTKVGGNETHYVKGNQTNTVSGDRTVSVKGTETENFNAQVTNIKTDQRTSVGGNQTNIVAGNQQNTVSGSKTETVKGSVTEKYGSQATTVDGDQSTNVGGNQSNVVAGNQTNTISGSKTESVKGAVTETYGSQSTTVNGNQSNTVKGTLTETVTGDVTEDYKANLSTTVGGNQTTTVTGDSSLSAKNITNTATNSITNKVGDNVSSSMTTNTITESVKDGTKDNTFTKTAEKDINVVKDGAKSNTFTKSAEKDINVVTDGTNTSTESQLADSVNTSLKMVDAEGKTTQSLSNVKTVSDDTTKITDTTKNAFSSSSQKADSITTTVKDTKTGTISERSQTVSRVQDKVGTTTVTITDGLTKLTNEAGTHNTQMDFAEVLKDLGVRGNATVDGNTTLGKEGADTTLTVNSTSTFNKDVTMKANATVERNLTVKGDTTMEGSATVKKDLTVDGATNLKGDAIIGTDENNTLTVNSKSTFNNGVTVKGGTTTDTLHVTSTATFDDIVIMKSDLNVGGNAKVAGDVTAKSFKVGENTYIDENGINANGQVIKNVGKGDISNANSTDAVSGGQLYETNTRVSGLETRMGTVETKVDKLDGKIDKVGANAAAMANLHPLEFDEDSKWNVAAAVGSSGSETASAVGVFYRPNENVMVNASAAMGTGENMFGGGVSLRLGHGGNKAKEAQMKAAAAENKELRAKVDDLTARMDALLSVLNPNMSKDFPDVPENHWAYEAVSRLAGNGIVEGYEDGKYHGERQMTRYEMAEIIYNALSKGAKAEKKLVEEFRPELQAMAAQKKA